MSSELVVKSNNLIEAGFRLSLVEQQIVLYAIARARDEQKGLKKGDMVTINAAEFAAVFGTDLSNVYGQLKHALNTLYERSVSIHDTDPASGKPRVVSTRWISDKAYVEGAGTVQLTFAPKVVPYITRLEAEFTSYRLAKISAMTSVHAIRIYELLVQYVEPRVRTISVEDLRASLCLTSEYPAFADFRKRVLDTAVAQINDLSDLNILWAPIKTGRKITALEFSIKVKRSEPRKPPKPAAPERDDYDDHAGEKAYVKKLAAAAGMTVREFAGCATPGETWDQLARRLSTGAA